MSQDNKRNFILHGSILAMAGIFVRIIGMVYRIPVLNIIGSEGNGIYVTAYNVYNIILVLSSYGLPMAVSKLISARFTKRRYKNAAKVLRCSLTVGAFTGGVAALLVYFGADFIENVIYGGGVPGLAIPLRVLAPTIFIVALLGVLRGFFQGQGTMIPTAVSQLVEQIMNAVVSILAAYLLTSAYKNSVETAAYGAAGGTMGTAFGALSGLILLVVIYILYRPTFRRMIKKDKVSSVHSDKDVYKTIIITMIPIILGQTLYQISAVIDDAMFSNIMVGRNISSNIKADLGNFSSSYSLLIGIPQGVASAMSASMLPSIVASYTQGDNASVKDKIAQTIKTNMFIAIPSFVGLVTLGKPIIQLLFSRYNSTQGAMMLKIGAIAVVFYTLATVTSSALQGIDKMNVPVKHSLISLVVHIVLVYFMLRWSRLGIYGIVIGNASFPILIFILNLKSLKEYIDYDLEYIRTFLIPLCCSVIMGIAVSLTYKLLYSACHINIVALMCAFVVAGVTYFGTIFLLKKKGKY